MNAQWKLLSKLVFVFVVLGCTDTNFNGDQRNSPRERTASGDVETIKITCDEQDGNPIHRLLEGDAAKRFVIEGDLCHKGTYVEPDFRLNVLFVIDTSGSMERNDPYKNGTCGRYKSVEAILSKIRNSVDPSVQVDVGIVGFETNAFTIAKMDTINSTTSFSREGLCRDSGYTNYEGAFDLASSMLSGKLGRKALYFISDGLPTESSQGKPASEKLGLESANSLRQFYPDLTMFSVYLTGDGNVDNSTSVTTVKDPKEYLGKITGDVNNVTLVSNADKLATEIAKFDLPTPTDSNLSMPMAKLKAVGHGEQDIPIQSFKKLAEERWQFRTEEFLPFYEVGAIISNEVVIQTTTIEGETKTLTLNLEFKLPGS